MLYESGSTQCANIAPSLTRTSFEETPVAGLMPRFNLAAMVRRLKRPRRKAIPIREIAPPGTLATNLYRAAYLPVIEAWSGALDRLMATYERTLAQMTTDSPADMDADLTGLGRELDRLVLTLTPRLRDWAIRLERWHRGKWRGAVLAASGVDLETLIGPAEAAETVEALIARNVGLVRNISDEARGRISDAIFRGLTNRTPAREVARQLREAVGMARARALRVASDQLTKATSALDTERMREAGIDAWLWRHSGKLHPRPEHKARDGKRFTWNDPPADMPGELPYCGCRKQAVLEFD